MSYYITLEEHGAVREHALNFIVDHIQQKYKNTPSKESTPRHLFVAQSDTAIIGTIALQLGDTEPLFFEEIYAFEREHLPIPYLPEKTVYFSRFIAHPGAHENVSISLMYEATLFALSHGYLFGACTLKPFVERFVLSKKIPWKKIVSAKLCEEKIPKPDQGYFLNGPPAMPYLIDLKEKRIALEKCLGIS